MQEASSQDSLDKGTAQPEVLIRRRVDSQIPACLSRQFSPTEVRLSVILLLGLG